MKIFQAIQKADTVLQFYEKTQIKLNYLIAFNYIGKQMEKLTKDYREMIDTLYLESGGYAVRQGKARVILSQYADYLQSYGHLFDRFTSLDNKHNDLPHNLSNLLYLQENLPEIKDRLIPVLHEPQDYFQEIKSLADLGFDYVAIGTPKKIKDAVFEQTRKELPQMKLHLLGKLNRQILIKHRPDSADASSWLRAAVYGMVHYWHPEEHKEYRIYVGEGAIKNKSIVRYKNFQYKEQLDELITGTFEYTPQDIVASLEARSMLNLYFYKQLENYINNTRNCQNKYILN